MCMTFVFSLLVFPCAGEEIRTITGTEISLSLPKTILLLQPGEEYDLTGTNLEYASEEIKQTYAALSNIGRPEVKGVILEDRNGVSFYGEIDQFENDVSNEIHDFNLFDTTYLKGSELVSQMGNDAELYCSKSNEVFYILTGSVSTGSTETAKVAITIYNGKQLNICVWSPQASTILETQYLKQLLDGVVISHTNQTNTVSEKTQTPRATQSDQTPKAIQSDMSSPPQNGSPQTSDYNSNTNKDTANSVIETFAAFLKSITPLVAAAICLGSWLVFGWLTSIRIALTKRSSKYIPEIHDLTSQFMFKNCEDDSKNILPLVGACGLAWVFKNISIGGFALSPLKWLIIVYAGAVALLHIIVVLSTIGWCLTNKREENALYTSLYFISRVLTLLIFAFVAIWVYFY